jgi:Family of unknown function (DUF6088)
VRERVLAAGEHYWSLADFRDLPAAAAAHALSRLAGEGELQRVRKGLYYRPKATVIGPSIPSPTIALAKTARTPLHPSGLTATNVLGLSTQNPTHGEFATPAAAAPGGLTGAIVHTRRPASRLNMSDGDAALFELLRDRARNSDLSPEQTSNRLVSMVADPARFQRLATVALSEPPRVRAMLGAIGQQAGAPEAALDSLRASLNPLSRFEFGILRSLDHAREWQAR